MSDTSETHLTKGELFNKRLVLYTLCGVTTLFSVTVCTMVMRGLNVPEILDRLVTFAVGNLTGILTATGVNRMAGADGEPIPVTNTPGEPLQVEPVEAGGADVNPADEEGVAEYEPPSPLAKAIRK